MGVRSSLASAFLLLAAAGGVAASESGPVVIGLVPGESEVATRELERGARLALELARIDDVVVHVGPRGTRWGSAAGSAVALVREHDADVLIAPRDRAAAHLTVQIGTKTRVPVVSTADAASVTGSGSRWVLAVPRTLSSERAFVAAYRAAHASEPGADASVGCAAVELVVAALGRELGTELGSDRRPTMARLRSVAASREGAGMRVTEAASSATGSVRRMDVARRRRRIFPLAARCAGWVGGVITLEGASEDKHAMSRSTAQPLPTLRVVPPTRPDPIPDWVHALATPVWVSAPDGLIAHMNAAAAALLDVSPEQGTGLPCHAVVRSTDDQGRSVCSARCAVRSGAERGEALAPMDAHLGGDSQTQAVGRRVRWLVIPVTAPDGTGPWLVHCAQDVEREHRATGYVERLASRSARLRGAIGPHASQSAPKALSPRETQVLDLLAEDEELGRIAYLLGIRHTTARNHVQRILAKLRAHSVQEAIALRLLR